ncbi:MAG: hypothetical protein JWR33_2253 [Naasia sp.]|jgi:hypothetical protein|uniref:hypothetical protein n=1 Tax=Naasia sp. TaxID=2546198 RepID=UPI00261B18FF|nr:hypothetical protein [Naasia sp.]MCU1571512.1 hypothetical protein [Naasia sp.]
MLDTVPLSPADIPTPANSTPYLPVPATRTVQDEQGRAEYSMSRSAARGGRRAPLAAAASYVLAAAIVVEGLAIVALVS